MPSLVSPLAIPLTSWAYSIVPEVTIAPNLRYSGYKFRGLRATLAAGGNVLTPGPCVLVHGNAGKTVEVQINPFPIQAIAANFPWGLPTFYFVFDQAPPDLSFADWDGSDEGKTLCNVTAVTIVMAPQNRLVLDPALWVTQIDNAINAAGTPSASWHSFATAVATAAFNSGPSAPVLLLDHNGRPRADASIQVGTSPPVTMLPIDGGDLQKTMARTGNPSLFGLSTSFTLTPESTGSSDFQLVRLEDGVSGAGSILVTSMARNIAFTNLHDWFAPQHVNPATLPRFTRGNKWKQLVNGPSFFADIFQELSSAKAVDCGFHLAGWAIRPEFEFVKRSDFKTLQDAAKYIVGPSGSNVLGMCRFLPSKFIQLRDNSSLTQASLLVLYVLLEALAFETKFDPNRFDLAGPFLLAAAIIATIIVERLFQTQMVDFEKNQPAVTDLEFTPNNSSSSRCFFSALPATIDDNTNVTAHQLAQLQNFELPVILAAVEHFGVYHQKLSIVRNLSGYIGYCGGIDFDSNRLDNADHGAKLPFHDLHVRVEGPAVSDLALTFEERWIKDGKNSTLAFQTPAPSALGIPGHDIMQVARTYYQSKAAARQLPFAPQGDRTILDTLLQAIDQAQEFIYIEDQYFAPPHVYQNHLLDKVRQGQIRKLIVTVPPVPDQPFGEVVRSGFIGGLRDADKKGNIVRVGYPRRRYTVPDNDRRASSGRCILLNNLAPDDTTIILGPEARVPDPPFWVCVEGELIWVYQAGGAPPQGTDGKQLGIERGVDTRLFSDGSGPFKRAHNAGAAATVVNLSGIYVHAKTMIVDDVFLSVGSANLTRRSLFHDGEVGVFTMPDSLKTSPGNPIAALRRTLWAEMLDLPAAMAAGVLEDPLSASFYFDRSPLLGNRYVDLGAYPKHPVAGTPGATGMLSTLLSALAVANEDVVFDAVIDPSSSLE